MRNQQHKGPVLLRFFYEMFKIALFVVGGGYAILAVANEVFGRRLKWLREGELLDHLPVFQMIPGLIAGNTAIYVGLRMAGRWGAVVGLVAVALPSYLIFLGVSYGYSWLPVDNPWVSGMLAGLRAALTGILFGTLVKGWRRSVRGVYGYVSVAVVLVLAVVGGWNPALILLLAMTAGIVWKFLGGTVPWAENDAMGLQLPPIPRLRLMLTLGGTVICVALISVFYGRIICEFIKFGLLGFGGGFVLVPLYLREFVGPSAPYLQLPMEEFSNLMALTQATPGPISVNAATFFGFRLGGVIGAAVATAALLTPSFFLLTAALTGLERWKRNRVVQGLLWGVKPATSALLAAAGLVFAEMSVLTHATGATTWQFHPLALALAVFAGWALYSGRLPIMWTLFASAAAGCAVAPWI